MSKSKDINKHVHTNQFILLKKPTLVEFQMEELETISNDKLHWILILNLKKTENSAFLESFRTFYITI